jgi:hypothetical protein
MEVSGCLLLNQLDLIPRTPATLWTLPVPSRWNFRIFSIQIDLVSRNPFRLQTPTGKTRSVKIRSRTKKAGKSKQQSLDGQQVWAVAPARHHRQIPYNRTTIVPTISFSPPHSIDLSIPQHDREDFGILTACPSFSTPSNSFG